MTRMPAPRQAAATRLMRSKTARPSGAAMGDPSTKQHCMSTFTSAVRSGTTSKLAMDLPQHQTGYYSKTRPVAQRLQMGRIATHLLLPIFPMPGGNHIAAQTGVGDRVGQNAIPQAALSHHPPVVCDA